MAEAQAQDQQAEAAVEQSTPDQAGSAGTGVTEATGTTESSESESEAIELVGQDKWDTLKDNPAELRKELNRAATKKFQELSEQRKRLDPYAEFISALDRDPRATITAIGKQLGLEIKGAEEKTQEEITAQPSEEITARVRKALGPEYEDLADRLIPAINTVAEEVAKKYATPLAQRQDEIIRESALRESRAVIDAFSKSHPGWEKHEKAMVELSKKLPPGEGMDETEYMNTLYYLATRDASEGDAAKKLATRMAQSARNVGDARQTTVSDRNVAKTPVKPPTFREAYQAAKEGRKYE